MTTSIEVAGVVTEDKGRPVLRIKGLVFPLTVAQLLHVVVGAKVPKEDLPCLGHSPHGLPCMKTRGHHDKHYYVKKTFKKRVPQVTPPETPMVASPVTKAEARKAAGLCAWCNGKAVKGKRLCQNHLTGARVQARKMLAKQRVIAKKMKLPVQQGVQKSKP